LGSRNVLAPDKQKMDNVIVGYVRQERSRQINRRWTAPSQAMFGKRGEARPETERIWSDFIPSDSLLGLHGESGTVDRDLGDNPSGATIQFVPKGSGPRTMRRRSTTRHLRPLRFGSQPNSPASNFPARHPARPPAASTTRCGRAVSESRLEP
jgi:hypothetical protein